MTKLGMRETRNCFGIHGIKRMRVPGIRLAYPSFPNQAKIETNKLIANLNKGQ